MTTVKVFDYVITTQTNITSLIKSNKQKLEITTKNPRKYKIITDKPITKHSSNLSCLDITSSDTTTSDPNSKIMENITTTYIRPWTRYTPGCFYNNTNSEPVSNNIKKCNVRRKAEILQYKKNSSRLTKAQKHAQFARGINKYNKKQYAYQSVNSVRNVSLTTDANPYGMKAIGPPNMSSDAVADWLKFNKNTSDSTFLNNARLNSTGLIELKCEKTSIVIPTPLSSSDVPRVSQNKINSNNPFPETPYGSIMDNALVMNKRDPLVNYTPVQRTYKGGSEKWPQSTWKEGDDGFPVGKKGNSESENVNYSFEDPNCVKLNIDITAAVTSNNDDANFSDVSNLLDDDVHTYWDSGLNASSSKSVHITINITDDYKNIKYVCIKSNEPSGKPSGIQVFDNAYNTDVIGYIPPDAPYNSSLPDNSSSDWCVIPCTITNATTKVINLFRSYTGHDESGSRFIINELQAWGGDSICVKITSASFKNKDDGCCYTTNDPYIKLTFTSSEPTTDFTICDVTVDGGTLSAFKATSSTVYTATFTPLGSGTNHKQTTNISVGNPFTCESVCWIYNNITLPTLSNVSIISNNLTSTTLAKVGNIVTLTFTASETIKTPTVAFKSGGHNISDPNITYSNISGNTWTASYTTNQGDKVGQVTYAISHYDMSDDEDLAGNTAEVIKTGSGLVNFVKTTLIYVNITSNNPTPTLAKVDDVITLTFIASDSLIDLWVTFTSGGDDITDTNITYSNTSGNTWTASYIANENDTSGEVKYTINYEDLAGNTGEQVTSGSRSVTFYGPSLSSVDNVKLTSNNPTPTLAKVGDKITLRFETPPYDYTKKVRLMQNISVTFKSGGTAIKNEITGGLAPGGYVHQYTPIQLDVDVYEYYYIVHEDDIEGDVTYTLNYTDKAGYVAPKVTNNTIGVKGSVTFDKIGPHIVSFSIDKEVLCVGEPVNVTIEFSEPIKNFTREEFNIAPGIDGSAVGSIHDFLNTNDTNFSFKFTPNQGLNVNSSNVLTLKNNWTDKAGNKAIMEIIPDTLTFDKSNLPIIVTNREVSSMNLKSNNSTSTLAKVGDIITLTFTVNGTIQTPVVTFKSGGIAITDQTIIYSNTSGNTWTASYITHEDDTNGEVKFSITYTDLHNCKVYTTPESGMESGDPLVTFDKTVPVIIINGESEIIQNISESYTDLGASVAAPHTNLVVTHTGEVDTNIIGTYIITYSATDLVGNIGIATRTVIVMNLNIFTHSVIDANNTTGGYGAGSQTQWQSFTMNKTGLLDKIEWKMSSPRITPDGEYTYTLYDIEMKLYIGEGIEGKLLLTSPSGDNSLKTPTGVPFTEDWVTWNIAAQKNIYIASGITPQVYTVQLSLSNNMVNNVGWVPLSINNPYSGGRAGPYNPEWDYLFKTWMKVSDNFSPNMVITAATSDTTNTSVPNGSSSNHETIVLIFTSSEPTADFNVEDITVSGGKLSDFHPFQEDLDVPELDGSHDATVHPYLVKKTPSIETSSTIYKATFTSDSGVTFRNYTIYVDSGKYHDSTDRPNNSSNYFKWLFDTIPPVTKGETILDSSNSNGGYAKVDDIITFEVEFTESVFLPPSPEEVTIKFKIGIEDRVAKAVSEFSNSNNKVFFQYTVVQGDIGKVKLPGSPVIVINSGYTIRDAASNYMTDFAIQSLNGSVQVNSTLPSAFNISVESTGGVIRSGYYNGTNTGIKITIPIANEPNLVDGCFLIQTTSADWSPTYTDWGSKIPITEAMLGNDYEYTSNDYNQAPGYIENGTVDIQVIITNAPGNSASSSTSLINDNTVPGTSAMSVVSSNNNTSLARVGDKVTLAFTSSYLPPPLPSITFRSGAGVISEDRVTTTESIDNIFTSEYTVVSSDMNGVVVFDITYTDEAGNTFSSLQNQSSVTVEILLQAPVFQQSILIIGDVTDPIEFRWDVPDQYQNDSTINNEILLYKDDTIDRQTRQTVSNNSYRPNFGSEDGTYYLKVRMIRLDNGDNIINQSLYVESISYDYNNPSSGGSVS